MAVELFFDIETQKLFEDISSQNPADLLVSIVSVYKRVTSDTGQELTGQMQSFWVDELSQMWPLFTNADRIIGFNSLKFDVPALAPLCPYDFRKINHFDLLDQIKNILGFRLSLNAVAKSTINHTKSDVGTNAVIYWREHSPESLAKLKSYCEMDVIVTRDVYDYGFKNNHLKYLDKWNTPRQFDVDFSYPVVINDPQLGLF